VNRYREQYERMKRRFARFSERGTDSLTDLSAQSLTDDALAFFESCLHLRDWIANDDELPQAVRNDAYPYVKASRILCLCHDIAVGAKHLTVKRPLAKDEKPRLRPKRTMEQRPACLVYGDDDDNFLLPGHLVQTISVRLMLETDADEAADALVFAAGCVKEWDLFFDKHGLS
jgi:hypothetical protein